MRDIVSRLYNGTWTGSVLLATSIVPRNQAEKIVEALTRCPGWRERVVAAKIASAFGLTSLAPSLVRTFATNPEKYTAIAFANLLFELQLADRTELLAELRAACPATSYGQHLLEVIEDACTHRSAT